MDLSEQLQVAQAAAKVAGQEITIPLKHIYRDALNVRKKKSKQSIKELAALIYSQGLLQNLVVRAELKGVKGKKERVPTGRYGVVAGGRRLEALHLLFTEGKIAADYPVRCLLVSQQDAVSVSCAENCGREPLHGSDLFDAFRAMADEGRTAAQIADAWGVSTLTVERRLKLADVSPKLMALYREDGIELEQLMVLTLVDDHATQEALWFHAPQHERSAYTLRSKITGGNVPPTHPLVQYVGFTAYEAAGGAVLRDLFSNDEAAPGYVTDRPLLERLALEALEREAEVLRAEGWSWVQARTSFTYSDRQAFDQCRTVYVEPSEEQQQRLDALEARLSELDALLEDLDPEAPEIAELEAQQEQANSEREAVEQSLRHIDPRDLSVAGAVVYVDSSGKVAVTRELVRIEDRKAQAAQNSATASASAGQHRDTGSAPAKQPRPEFSEKLLRQLTAHRTAALRAMLANNPAVALRVLAWQLALRTGLGSELSRDDAPVKIRADVEDVRKEGPDLAACRAQQEMDAHRERWSGALPREAQSLLAWVLKADDVRVLDLLAVCTASTLNTVQGRESPQPIADAIATAVGLDMADFWQPSAEGYLAAVPKAKVLDAVSEAVSPEAARKLDGLKKNALVAQAQQQLDGKRWLPSVLRARN